MINETAKIIADPNVFIDTNPEVIDKTFSSKQKLIHPVDQLNTLRCEPSIPKIRSS